MAKEDKSRECYVVLSCDGGSRPNPGASGCGIHGYLYYLEDINKVATDKPNNLIVTDKGLIHSDFINLYKDVKIVKPSLWIDAGVVIEEESTNNVAEVLAIGNALDICIKLKEEYNITKVLIRADSEYAIIFTQKIKSNTPDAIMANTNLIPYMQEKVNKIKELGITFTIDKVEGHSGDHGNELADNLATLSRLAASQLVLLPKSENKLPKFNLRVEFTKTRWGKVNDLDIAHPFIKFKQVFFNNHDLKRNPSGIIGIMDYKNDEDIGVKSNTATYGIVRLNKPSNIVQDAIDSFYNSFVNQSVLSILHIDKLLENNYLVLYKLFGKLLFTHSNKTSLFTVNNEPIAFNINPPGLATIALDKLSVIEKICKDFSKYKETGKSPFTYINITDKVYSVNKKGKLECIIPNGENYLPVEIELNKTKIIVHISLRSDTINRNKLKQLGDTYTDVEVYLVLEKQDDNTYIYYTLISTKNEDVEDIAVFTNYHSCKILLNKIEPKKKEKKK